MAEKKVLRLDRPTTASARRQSTYELPYNQQEVGSETEGSVSQKPTYHQMTPIQTTNRALRHAHFGSGVQTSQRSLRPTANREQRSKRKEEIYRQKSNRSEESALVTNAPGMQTLVNKRRQRQELRRQESEIGFSSSGSKKTTSSRAKTQNPCHYW